MKWQTAPSAFLQIEIQINEIEKLIKISEG